MFKKLFGKKKEKISKWNKNRDQRLTEQIYDDLEEIEWLRKAEKIKQEQEDNNKDK